MIYGRDYDGMTDEEFEKWEEEQRTEADIKYDERKDAIAENNARERTEASDD